MPIGRYENCPTWLVDFDDYYTLLRWGCEFSIIGWQ